MPAHLVSVASPSRLAWAADGQRIAASVNRHTGSGDAVFATDPVLVFNAADGRVEHLVALEEGTRVERLEFHPDSESIVLTTWSGEMIWQWIGRPDRRIVREGVSGALTFSAGSGSCSA